jgi:hypothetical protein
MRHLKNVCLILILSLGFSCKKSDNSSLKVYKFNVVFNGNTYSWSGGYNETDMANASCFYNPRASVAVLLEKDSQSQTNYFQTLLEFKQTGVGTFNFNTRFPDGIQIGLGDSRRPVVWTSDRCIINITEISPEQLGIVKGNFSGTMISPTNTSATISGSFEAVNGSL